MAFLLNNIITVNFSSIHYYLNLIHYITLKIYSGTKFTKILLLKYKGRKKGYGMLLYMAE